MRKNPTTLVIFDLNNERIGPLAIVAAMKQDPALAVDPDGRLRVARADRRDQRRAAGRRRRSAGAIGVRAAARRDPDAAGLKACATMSPKPATDDDRRPARAAADRAVHPPHAARALGLAVRDCPARTCLLKPESLQRSNSFKCARRVQRRASRASSVRAAPPAQLVTASAGNHGRGARGRGEDVQPAARRLHAARRAEEQARRDPPRRRRPAARRPRLRRSGADGEGVREGDRRRVHLAVQRSPT